MPSELSVGKLDAARRQLKTAICLYIHEGDPISIHTLTAAAYNVIRDINKRRGGKSMFVKRVDIVKPQHIKEFQRKLNEAENFFKHADRDPDGTLKFKPDITEYLILDACFKYYELTGETIPACDHFVRWFMLNHPNLFVLTPEEEKLHKLLSRDKPSRQTYFSTVLGMTGIAENSAYRITPL